MKTMEKRRPVVFGEVLFDQFPDGSVVLGGAPFNVAWHLQAFGAAPLLISRVGDDALGRRIRSAMQEWGMDLAGLQLDSAHPTGRVQVEIEEGEPRFAILPDQAYDFIDSAMLPPVDSNAFLYHGSLALRRPESRTAFQRLRTDTAAPVFMDVNLRPPWWQREMVLAHLGNADWAKLNEEELRSLASAIAPGDLVSQAAALQNSCELSLLIVTRGAHGALARTAAGSVHEVSPGGAVQVVDAVGAGDAFASVMLLGLLDEWPLDIALERAQRFASAVVGIRGATPTDKGFYTPFVETWSNG